MRQALEASRRDAWITLGALATLVLWEISGLDLVLTRWIAAPQGFAWRDSLLASGVLHRGGRALSWVLLSLLVWDAVRPIAAGPSQIERVRGIGVVLAGMLLVPLLKRFTATSCPWDLAEFGGSAAYVPHWVSGLTDGGPGHCFPSGHAVAAFAFFGVYFTWRQHRPRAARVALLAVRDWHRLRLGTVGARSTFHQPHDVVGLAVLGHRCSGRALVARHVYRRAGCARHSVCHRSACALSLTGCPCQSMSSRAAPQPR